MLDIIKLFSFNNPHASINIQLLIYSKQQNSTSLCKPIGMTKKSLENHLKLYTKSISICLFNIYRVLLILTKSYDQNIAHVIQLCISWCLLYDSYIYKFLLFVSFEANLNNNMVYIQIYNDFAFASFQILFDEFIYEHI